MLVRVASFVLAAAVASAAPLATTPLDFVQPGTQPSPAELDDFASAQACALCHGDYRAGAETEPSDAWAASMMAQSARDPVVRAAAAIANADAAGSAETCIRCHAPVGWLGGRSTGGDFASLEPADLEGVGCHFCHRMLDPIARGDAPAVDAGILAALDQAVVPGLPVVRPGGRCAGDAAVACTADAQCGAAAPCEIRAGQGRFVVDPDDTRRAPRTLTSHLHPGTLSPFHSRSDACAPCHDVSTATFSRAGAAIWTLNALDAAHPTQEPNDMFPEQRTYSEWRASAFATSGVVFPDGRFGGAKTAKLPNTVPVSTCQDCHMPDAEEKACSEGPVRPDAAIHTFAGANAWVLGAVLDEYGAASGLTEAAVGAARARTQAMMEAAADLEVTQVGYRLTVRVVNQTGHKLPTGYPEGRRMWLGVRFFAGADPTPIAEDGRYDEATATLDLAGTSKVYEVKQVIADDVAAASGLAVGTPFHLVLNGAIASDNRIPPRGFVLAAFDTFGGAPVGHAYADGQHWDDTDYTIPLAATRVEVSLYHQTTTREYAEFLRDVAPDATGQNAYDRWLARGRSAPVSMARTALDLVPICTPDGSACDDANPCTTADVCTAGACSGPLVPCPDDGNACTDDVCVPATGACGASIVAPCDDGDACTTADACADGACGGTIDGLSAFRCELDVLAAPGVCPDALPRPLRRGLAKRGRKLARLAKAVERKLERGAGAQAVARKLAAMDRLLQKLTDRVDAAASSAKPSGRIEPNCAAALRRILARERDALARLQPTQG
jgi:hypothetical protein